MTTDTDAAKAVVQRWLGAAWSQGDYAVLPVCLAPDATIRFLAGGDVRPYGPAQAEAHIRAERACFSDYGYTIHQLVAEGDTVVAVAAFGGVHDRGPLTLAGTVVSSRPPGGAPRSLRSSRAGSRGARSPRSSTCSTAPSCRNSSASLGRGSPPPTRPAPAAPRSIRRTG